MELKYILSFIVFTFVNREKMDALILYSIKYLGNARDN